MLEVKDGVDARGSIPFTWKDEQSLSCTLGDGSRAMVVITILPGSPDRTLNVTLAEGSALFMIVLAAELSGCKIAQSVTIGRDAQCKLLNVTLGGKEIHQDVIAKVEGDGGVSSIDWIFHVSGDEEQKLTVRNVFLAKNGGGEITVKGVAEGHAQTKCNGMIEIGESGGGTNTYLTQNVLMLDATAKVDAIPGLEIRTNNVKASHSATVTKVSDEELFYFASRGIRKEEARTMYINGFLRDLLSKIADEQVRGLIEAEIEKRMAK